MYSISQQCGGKVVISLRCVSVRVYYPRYNSCDWRCALFSRNSSKSWVSRRHLLNTPCSSSDWGSSAAPGPGVRTAPPLWSGKGSSTQSSDALVPRGLISVPGFLCSKPKLIPGVKNKIPLSRSFSFSYTDTKSQFRHIHTQNNYHQFYLVGMNLKATAQYSVIFLLSYISLLFSNFLLAQ